MSVLGSVSGADKIPAAPDMSANIKTANDISKTNAANAASQYQWAQGQVAQNQNILQQIQAPTLGQQQQAAGASTAALQNYQQNYAPLEQQMVNTATNYASQANQNRAAATAEAGVGQAYNAQRQNAQRQLESYGVDPSQTRYAALDAGMRQQQAADQAAAANQARLTTKQQAIGLQQQALNYGAGQQAMGLNYGNQAINAGSTAGATQNNLSGTNASLAGTASLGFTNAAMGANTSAVNTANSQFNNQLQSAQAKNAAVSQFTNQGASMAGAFMKGGIADGGVIPYPEAADGGAISALHTVHLPAAAHMIHAAPSGASRAAAMLSAAGSAVPGQGAAPAPVAAAPAPLPMSTVSQAVGPVQGAVGATLPTNMQYPGSAFPAAADGGQPAALSPPGVADNVIARVSPGEFVVPADVVQKKGTEFFEKLIHKYHIPAAQQRAAIQHGQ